jgi:hydroxyacylglutathione hydrolase
MFDVSKSLFRSRTGYTDIEPHDALASLASYHLVDVREPHEYRGELGHIEGAELIPLSTLPDAIERLRALDKPLLVICRSGARSARGAELLVDGGLERVFNLRGGMLQWSALRLPTCPGAARPRAHHPTANPFEHAGAAPCC